MANKVLNSTYGINYNVSGTSATIGPKPEYGILYFNADSNNTFYFCTVLKMSLQDIVNNFSMDLIVNAYNMYSWCTSLTGSPVCGSNVINASNMYCLCRSLTGQPRCGSSVTNACGMYYGCNNLTGSPVCPSSVTDASYMYYYCNNLTGQPRCGSSVTNACGMYCGCTNLTGFPVCPSSVTDASRMYYYCTNLIGSPVCGTKVTDASYMYENCYNLTRLGSGRVYMNNVTNCYRMLAGRPTGADRINLYINPSKLNLKNGSTEGNIMGIATTWSTMSGGYYNVAYNIFVYANAT